MLYHVSMRKHDIDIRVDRLQQLVDKRGVSLGQIEVQTGVSKSQMSLLLSGKRGDVYASALAALATYFDVSVDYLMGLTDYPRPYRVEGKMLDTDEAEEVASIVDALLPGHRKDMLAIVQAVKSREDAMSARERRFYQMRDAIIAAHGVEEWEAVIDELSRLGGIANSGSTPAG